MATSYPGSHPFVAKPDDIVDGLLQLAVDREHGDAVHVRPDVLRQLRAGDPCRSTPCCLQRDERIDEHLKRAARPPLPAPNRCGSSADEPAEHDPVVRRVRDGETHVGGAHRLESLRVRRRVCSHASCELQAQRAKPLARDGRQERRFVGEMAVERRARDAEPLADAAQRQRLDPAFLDRAQRLLQERPGQVAVVVAILARFLAMNGIVRADMLTMST